MTAAEAAVGKDRAAGELPADGSRQAPQLHRALAEKGSGEEAGGERGWKSLKSQEVGQPGVSERTVGQRVSGATRCGVMAESGWCSGFQPGSRFQRKWGCQRRWPLGLAFAHGQACERGWR